MEIQIFLNTNMIFNLRKYEYGNTNIYKYKHDVQFQFKKTRCTIRNFECPAKFAFVMYNILQKYAICSSNKCNTEWDKTRHLKDTKFMIKRSTSNVVDPESKTFYTVGSKTRPNLRPGCHTLVQKHCATCCNAFKLLDLLRCSSAIIGPFKVLLHLLVGMQGKLDAHFGLTSGSIIPSW